MNGAFREPSGEDAVTNLYERLFGRIGPEVSARRVLAVMWATVDTGRTLADLRLAGEPLMDDPLLGATAVLVRPADGGPIAVLEPNTEGRLSATLARHGEATIGEYVESPVGLGAVGVAATEAGLVVSRPADGPFGRSVVVLSTPVSGPHLVLVEPPASTIGR